eukprot:1105596-Pelagomonas_calceolata.AAC.10
MALPHRLLLLIILITWSYLRCSSASLNMYSVTSICIARTEGANATQLIDRMECLDKGLQPQVDQVSRPYTYSTNG